MCFKCISELSCETEEEFEFMVGCFNILTDKDSIYKQVVGALIDLMITQVDLDQDR